VSRALVWNTLFVPIRLLAELLANLLKLNALSPASFGLLALISNTNNGLGTLIDLGTGRALPKYIPESQHRGGTAATLRLLTAVLAIQVTVLLSIGIGLLLFSGRYLGNLQSQVRADRQLAAVDQTAALAFLQNYGGFVLSAIVLLLFLGVCYDMCTAYLSSFFRQGAWNTVDLAARLLPPLLSAAAILAGYDIAGVLAALVLASSIAVALALWYVLRLWGEVAQQTEPGAVTSDGVRTLHDWLPPGFVRYCGVSFLMTTTDFIASAGFAIFLADDVGDVALIWAGTSLVRMALAYLYMPMVGVQVPLFTRVRAGEGGSLSGAYQSLLRLQVLLLVPGGVGLILLAEPALAVISPLYLDATILVWILVPALFIESMLTTAHNALIVYEHLQIIVVARLLTLVVIVPLAIWLPPLFGVVGVVLAFGMARLAAGFWVTGSGMRLLRLRWPWRFTWRVLLATALMAAAVLGLRLLLPMSSADLSIMQRLFKTMGLLGVAGGGTLVFLLALRLSGGLEPQDREQLAKLKLPFKQWLFKLL
jgi:O-antigen/teichoic acid export membrane protein